MKFVDISYYYNNSTDAGCLLREHAANLGYLEYVPKNLEVSLIKFLDAEGYVQHGRTRFHFFKGSASGRWMPKTANKFIAQLDPDVVLFHGMIFPLKLLALKRQLPGHTKLIVQHHAELPAKGIKGWFQQLACKAIDAYIFSAKELADPWVNRNLIDQSKIYEVMEGSAWLEKIDKQASRKFLQLQGGKIFLWVGRLNANKDPLTVLKGFEKYLESNAGAKLYMIFQDNELLPQVQQTIKESSRLSEAVILKGKVEKQQMPYWYNAADAYLSGSHSEGSGYALIEAMSCGCIPVVTSIPSFRKITANGNAGILFSCDNPLSLYDALLQLDQRDKKALTAQVAAQFENELSFKAIARQMTTVCEGLMK